MKGDLLIEEDKMGLNTHTGDLRPGCCQVSNAGMKALHEAQAESQRNGTADMTLDEINAEIAGAREKQLDLYLEYQDTNIKSRIG